MDTKLRSTPTALAGAFIVETERALDHRGAFARLFCCDALQGIIGGRRIQQINYSRTHRIGAVRGIHYQRQPHAEMKLVRCLRGKVWDIAVDLRAGSPTFLQWHAEELSAENGRMFIIPEGCGHGFQVFKEDSELLYLHTEFYTPAYEGGVHPQDPLLRISWPLPVCDLSERDRTQVFLSETFEGLII
jgi:dTDP-4-dehydrorhamnose 3,5-epimerase